MHGIDVARYQGDIDWKVAARSGVAFAWIKATEGGDHLDKKFYDNWYGAKEAGVPRGAYHFYYFCRTPEEQAAWFIANVPYDPDALPMVLDMEWNNHSKTCTRIPKPDVVRKEMVTFLEIMEGYYGKRPVIYTDYNFHTDNLEGVFNGHHFWLRSIPRHPSERFPGRRWTFWQYTAQGNVDGIKGHVDRNTFVGSWEDWKKFLKGDF
ncbi:Phage lysin, glycosyl hydrolase, family 25 [Lutibaculum baratangense AMV1]|uniref:Phage lysin, glycosyl hydrolase, family 25 n=1 Tax=Lutibaculum baratangense AMV1 TaxID=631454 RepID=V4RMQ5_9HYPH|nr:Phage lysin, glycosyl hydrolase, family 25 [Lutibaculum baratangense AMV1]